MPDTVALEQILGSVSNIEKILVTYNKPKKGEEAKDEFTKYLQYGCSSNGLLLNKYVKQKGGHSNHFHLKLYSAAQELSHYNSTYLSKELGLTTVLAVIPGIKQ